MKKYYYVQVVCKNKVRFVTNVDYEFEVSYWEDNEPFKVFSSLTEAQNIALGLCVNGFYAFVVVSFYKLTFTNNQLD